MKSVVTVLVRQISPEHELRVQGKKKNKKLIEGFGEKENTATHFSWRGDLYLVLSGVHTYSFTPSEVTKGHTTFVNSEKFARLMYILVGTGIMDVRHDFAGFNVLFKKRVEDALKEEATR